MSSRIALLRDGCVEQVDPPRRLYEFPATRYAADFIGSVNLFDGQVVSQQEDQVRLYSDALATEVQVRHGEPLPQGSRVTLAIRPEKIGLVQGDEAVNRVRGRIKEIAYLGDVSIYHVELATGQRVQFTQSNTQALAEQPLTWDDEVTLGWQPNSCGVLTA